MNVLVTGGSRGIGLSIVKKMAALNHRVVYTYKNTPAPVELPNVTSYKLDLTEKKSCDDLYSYLSDNELMPNVLVNNAGVTCDKPFHKMTNDEWLSVINVNLISLFNITQPVFSHMRLNGFGRIINISSVNAHKGQFGQVNYCASKAGVLGFTKALALEGAAKGVTVNSISPGYTETDMINCISVDILNKIKKDIPTGRFATPDEIATLVCFLSSKDASYINGADYSINGALY
ncbi:SDR family NAD(P)-dependent oxidoreductase [Aeromonas caviae]|uniref:Reductase n=2 Tax=Aeromonas TaxID=642 RepID=A0A346ACS5_AERHY|nr:reductase [Aeromonas hydrophila]